jgi:hypothetical protein
MGGGGEAGKIGVGKANKKGGGEGSAKPSREGKKKKVKTEVQNWVGKKGGERRGKIE